MKKSCPGKGGHPPSLVNFSECFMYINNNNNDNNNNNNKVVPFARASNTCACSNCRFHRVDLDGRAKGERKERVVSPTSRLANVLFANFWSRFAYVLGQLAYGFRLISGWKNEVYTCVSHFFVSWLSERTKHIHAQRSFRFLAEGDPTIKKGWPG